MMKYGYIILSLLLFLSCQSRASGMDFLHGEVLDIDPKRLIITVQTDYQTEADQIVVVSLPQELMFESGSGELRLPGCITPGKHIRIWGTAAINLNSTFKALKVRGCGMALCNDPTGVRERLFRNRNGAKRERQCQ